QRGTRRLVAYFGGAGEAGGVAGGVVAGAAGSGFCWVVTGGAGVPLTSDRGPRWPRIASTSAPTMKSTAHTVVIFVSNVAPPRAPNAVWLPAPPDAPAVGRPPPPSALAMSPPLPCCSRMTSNNRRHTRT